MSDVPLNKFEKEKKVIEWYLEGKTYREISKLHITFRDIKKIIKAYEKKVRLQNKKEENNQFSKIKKLSKSSQAYERFLKGKTPVEVAIELDLDFPKVRNYWTEFLRLQNMKELYNMYIENEFHLDPLFRIYYFMKRNNIPIRDMEDVLRAANDVINLNKMVSNLKAEIEQMKNNYLLNQNTNRQQLLPLGLPEYYYKQQYSE